MTQSSPLVLSPLRASAASLAGSALNAPARSFERAVALTVMVLPGLGFVAAAYGAVRHGVGAMELTLTGVMYALTMIGAEGGLHRLYAHRAFSASRPIKILYAILGSMAAEGPVLWFASIHRRHHGLSDRPHDPHSPYFHRDKELGHLEGLWHSHLGWMMRTDNNAWLLYVPDLVRDRLVFRLSEAYFVWVGLGFALPALAGGIWTGSWAGAFSGFLWGGLVRMFLVHHVMWCVGSICHIVGSQRFDTNDESRNNALIGVLAFGVGWHNNHHAFQGSARIGLRWWEIDVNYYVIRLFESLGWVWDVKLPTPELIEAKKLPPLAPVR